MLKTHVVFSALHSAVSFYLKSFLVYLYFKKIYPETELSFAMKFFQIKNIYDASFIKNEFQTDENGISIKKKLLYSMQKV